MINRLSCLPGRLVLPARTLRKESERWPGLRKYISPRGRLRKGSVRWCHTPSTLSCSNLAMRILQNQKRCHMSLSHKFVDSPVGRLKLVASDKGLVAILWDSSRRVRLEISEDDASHPLLQKTKRQLEEYFAGKRRTFSLPLDMRGTAFKIRSGRRFWRFHLARHEATASWRVNLETRRRRVQWARRTDEIRSRLSYRAIA
jgi:hypothetical protein